MVRFTTVACTAILVVLAASIAFAEDPPAAPDAPVDPKDVTIGEAHIKLDTDYAKPMLETTFDDPENPGTKKVEYVDWEQHVFDDNGFLLIISNLDRTKEYKFKLMPMYDDLEQPVVTIKTKGWKLKKLNKTTKMWRNDMKVKVKKKK